MLIQIGVSDKKKDDFEKNDSYKANFFMMDFMLHFVMNILQIINVEMDR